MFSGGRRKEVELCMLKRILCLLLAAALFLPACAFAEEDPDPETVTYLDFGDKKMQYKKVLEILDQYPNLEKVDMFGTVVDLKKVNELTERYPNIEFGWTMNVGGDHLVRTDTTAFSTLHSTGEVGHTTEEIAMLRFCKNIRALDVGHNRVNDISWLADLKELRILIIAVNHIEDISPLANLTKLEYLEVFNNFITDISPLKGLTHLMDLNLCFNLISDYSPLYEMTWLKRLWLCSSKNRTMGKVPQEVQDKLELSLEDCYIDYTSWPSNGGWRDHEHFWVQHDIFRSPDGYMPFSDSWPDTDDGETNQ